jgi:hypothetical protein
MVKEDNEMHVWQTSLLELNSEDMGHRNTQSTFLMLFVRGHLFISLPSLSSPPPSYTPLSPPTLTPVHMYTPSLSVPSLDAKL